MRVVPGVIQFEGRRSPERTISQDVFGVCDGDGHYIASTGVSTRCVNSPNLFVVVADGLGAHPIGRTAAAVSISSLLRLGPAPDKSSIVAATDSIHARLQSLSRRHGFRQCAGAAIAGAVYSGKDVLFFSAGDVGIFDLSQTRCTTPVLAFDRGRTGRLTNCVGGTFSGGVSLRFLRTTAFRRTLLCTDGVWECEDDLALHDRQLDSRQRIDDAIKVVVEWSA